MKDLGIWEPLSVKVQTYKTAIEVRGKSGTRVLVGGWCWDECMVVGCLLLGEYTMECVENRVCGTLSVVLLLSIEVCVCVCYRLPSFC